jgi:hypothetical protein
MKLNCQILIDQISTLPFEKQVNFPSVIIGKTRSILIKQTQGKPSKNYRKRIQQNPKKRVKTNTFPNLIIEQENGKTKIRIVLPKSILIFLVSHFPCP